MAMQVTHGVRAHRHARRCRSGVKKRNEHNMYITEHHPGNAHVNTSSKPSRFALQRRSSMRIRLRRPHLVETGVSPGCLSAQRHWVFFRQMLHI
jgi:hypothetical protein